MDIFKLVGSVYVDTDKANDSLQKTGKEAEKTGDKLGKIAGTAGKLAVGVAGAATAVGGAMIASAKSAAENADTIDKASQRMKVSTDTYQELAHAASLSGVEMSTLEKAAKKLEGTDMSMDDALASIYELGTAEERSAKAAELFGDTVAYSMTPMLNASAEEMDAMRQEAHDLGLVMGEDTVKAGAAMNDTFSKVQDSFGAIVTQIGIEVMPLVSELLQVVLDNMPTIKRVVSQVMSAVKTAVNAVIPVVQKLSEWFGAIAEKVAVFAEKAAPVVNVLGGLAGGVANAIGGGIDKLLGTGNDIPMMADGGTIIQRGQAIVGEAGPELIEMPVGAKVTPLSGAGASIDYDKMTASFLRALRAAAPDLKSNVTVSADSRGIFNAVRDENRVFSRSTGRSAFA